MSPAVTQLDCLQISSCNSLTRLRGNLSIWGEPHRPPSMSANSTFQSDLQLLVMGQSSTLSPWLAVFQKSPRTLSFPLL